MSLLAHHHALLSITGEKFTMPDYSNFLLFSGSYAFPPSMANIRTVRTLWRFMADPGQRASHLFDLDGVNNSYSVAMQTGYGEFGDIEQNIPYSTTDGIENTLKHQKYDYYGNPPGPVTVTNPGAFFEYKVVGGYPQAADFHLLTFETDAPVTSRPILFTRGYNGNPVYMPDCQVAFFEFWSRQLTTKEVKSGKITNTAGLLARYDTTRNAAGDIWLDQSGNGNHAQIVGTFPRIIIQAGSTLGWDSNRRFLYTSNLSNTLKQSNDNGGVVVTQTGWTFAYVPYYGEEFYIQATRFVLSGLANQDGGTFEVYLNGVSIGIGDCYNPSLVSNKVYFDSGVLPPGIYRVHTEKRTGYAHWLDQLQTF